MNPYIAILGGGSYATALVKVFNDNQIPVLWWVRRPEAVHAIRHHGHNPSYLSSVKLNTDLITVSSDPRSIMEKAGSVIIGIPSAFVHGVLLTIDPSLFPSKNWISVVKGVIPETDQVMAEYLQQQYQIPFPQIGMITGPSHAEEIALERLTFLTAPAGSIELSHRICHWLNNDYIKVLPSLDVLGAEYSAVLKNVFALAAGMFHGLGYGDNFHAFFLTNAIREIREFLNHVCPGERDVNESAYLGDLLVTSYSTFSRNRTLGNMIGKGYSVSAALAEMNMVAEGYFATRSLYIMNQTHQVKLPILDAVYQILYESKPCTQVLSNLTQHFR